jgi:hypothetical protein
MIHKKNAYNRRSGALQRLKSSVFFDKINSKGVARKQDEWQDRKDKEIEILERRLNA